MTWKPTTIFIAAWTLASLAGANNLKITNVTSLLVSRHYAGVQMDLSWENSWRDECNHDAAWVFVKYSLDGGTNWLHATLHGVGTNPAGYSAGSNPNLDIIVPDDRKGAFIQPRFAGRTNIATAGLTLLWDLDADGIPVKTTGRVSVHGLEMVYIPTGPFYVGDDSSVVSFKVTYINTNDVSKTAAESGSGVITNPYVNLTAGLGRPWGVTGTFDTNYPNGYSAFYIMKHELSRARYLAFLNLLTITQVATLRIQQVNFSGTSGTIGGVSNSYPLSLTNAQPWRAAVFAASDVPSACGWQQHAAYLDWAALRPLTEMEYEKACRGPLLPVDRDYPWGTAGHFLVNWLTNSGSAVESASNHNANLVAAGGVYTPLSASPLRCGAMCDATTDQFQAGASYYGVLELVGNAWEWCIATCRNTATGATPADALKYSGAHGDGQLNTDGTASVTNWPAPVNNIGTSPIGARGGDAGTPTLNCRISDRSQAANTWYVGRGIRGGRTAP